MHKYFLPLIVLLGLLPMTALAAFDDVQFSEDTNIHVVAPDITLVVSANSKVAGMTIYDYYISLDLESGSSITFTSPQRQILSNSLGISTTCGTTTSALTITSTTTQTVTVTPGGSCPSPTGGAVVPVAPPSAPTMPVTTTGEVTATAAAGGKTTLTTAEGTTATVELPAAAVTADTIVKAESVAVATVTAAAPAPTGKTIVSAFDLTATSAGVAVTSFAQTLTVTLTYTDAQIAGLNETTLKIHRWTGTEWLILSTVVYPATNTLIATTSAFSYFAIIGEPAPVEEVVPEVPVVPITVIQIKAQMIEIIKQLIVLITQLIEIYQTQLAELQT